MDYCVNNPQQGTARNHTELLVEVIFFACINFNGFNIKLLPSAFNGTLWLCVTQAIRNEVKSEYTKFSPE